MTLRWADTPHMGKSGFVQSRLHLAPWPSVAAVVEFHAPVYYVEITRHVRGYVQAQHDGPMAFNSLEDAKAWATVVVRMGTS